MSDKKQELSMEDFEEVTGGARKIRNSNSRGTQKIANQGDNNSLNGNYHGGDGTSQQNRIEGNKGNVKVGGSVNISGGAGRGNTFNF